VPAISEKKVSIKSICRHISMAIKSFASTGKKNIQGVDKIGNEWAAIRFCPGKKIEMI